LIEVVIWLGDNSTQFCSRSPPGLLRLRPIAGIYRNGGVTLGVFLRVKMRRNAKAEWIPSQIDAATKVSSHKMATGYVPFQLESKCM